MDDIVAPRDNIDLITGGGFYYLDLEHTGHENVIHMDATDAGKKRREVFITALSAGDHELEQMSRHPSDEGPRDKNLDVANVVFVMHGIRDEGFWTQKIARRVQKLAYNPPKIYASETSSYGYFAMLPFLTKGRRRRKVEWLMDQYVEAKALYPDASFSYVGHSNGTYLLAQALLEYPSCQFEHVVFAGSVVPRKYDWERLIEGKQVKSVLNYVASHDCVVALFPGTLERLGVKDLGSGGHHGFDQITKHGGEHGSLFQCCVRGGHGAAIKEEYWEEIAHFVVRGVPSEVTQGRVKAGIPKSFWRSLFLGPVGGYLTWAGLVGLVVLVAVCIWRQKLDVGGKLLLEAVLAFVIWKILTRV